MGRKERARKRNKARNLSLNPFPPTATFSPTFFFAFGAVALPLSIGPMDAIVVNGVSYSGSSGPDGIAVAAGTVMTWTTRVSTDTSTTGRAGFKLCMCDTSTNFQGVRVGTRPNEACNTATNQLFSCDASSSSDKNGKICGNDLIGGTPTQAYCHRPQGGTTGLFTCSYRTPSGQCVGGSCVDDDAGVVALNVGMSTCAEAYIALGQYATGDPCDSTEGDGTIVFGPTLRELCCVQCSVMNPPISGGTPAQVRPVI